MPVSELQQYLTVKRIADAMNLSEATVRRLFQDRSGVVRITKGKRLRGKREYTTLRIPESVFNAFIQERSV